jgi:hypothetical protein
MAKLGLDAALYQGSTLMKNVRDLTLNDEKAAVDISTRGSKFALSKGGMRTISLEWEMLWDESDADFAAILAAYNSDTGLIKLKCLSSTDGSGIDADFEITKCVRTESLKEGILASVTAVPSYGGTAARYPTWVSGGGAA